MKRIIIDTDLCFDCDDALALAMANMAHRNGRIELLATTHCLSDVDCAEAICRINAYYHNEQISVGVSENCKIDCEAEKEYFINSMKTTQTKADKSKYPSSTELILEKLSENEACTLVFIGQLNNLAYLIEHKNNFYRGRKIGDILYTSIERIVIMGGDFSSADIEFNIIKDINAAKTVTAQTDLPLVFVDAQQGCDVYTGQEVQKERENPVSKIYSLFSVISGEKLRPSWDPIAVYFAIFGEDELCRLSPKGRVEVLDSGQTLFREGEGNHRLLKVDHKVDMAKEIESLFKRRSGGINGVIK